MADIVDVPPLRPRRTSTRATQLLALMFSLGWGLVPGFGLIDLETAVPPGNPDFRTHWFLEGSWGLLITTLVVIPLLVVTLRPSRTYAAIQQLHVLGGCAITVGLICLDASMMGLAAALAVTAWIVWMPIRIEVRAMPTGEDGAEWWPLMTVVATYAALPMLFGPDSYTVKVAGILVALLGLAGWLAYSPRPALRHETQQSRSRALLLVSIVACGPWIGYAVSTAAAYWEGLRYTGTVERISAQTTFALAVAALPLGSALGWLPIRLSVWTTSTAAAGFGAFAVLYPEHLQSPGAAWGIAAIIWSVVAIAVAESQLRLRKAAG